ncbi:MAG: class I SAM-dependent methyltransferase, partial [Chthoniobacterales bacterium]
MPPHSRQAEREDAETARHLAHERGETSATRLPAEGLSTPKIVQATIDKIRQIAPQISGNYLDLGSGNGELIDRVIREFPVTPRACDYRADLLTIGSLEVDVADLNRDALPYADQSFDLVTCTEVIEHLEHFRSALREVYRVLRPAGIFVVSTPNVLNLRSRLRYLLFGFANMFGPLKLGDDRHHSTHGHINPVGYFYVAHALDNAGFSDISVSVDKLQRGSWLAFALLWLPLRIASLVCLRKERVKYDTLDRENEPFVRAMNSTQLLLGRTIVVGCRK